jgi:predicted nucleic acid-binding protein
VRGDLVPDAHLASCFSSTASARYTRDADFRKFPFLEVRDPFAA